MEPGRPSMEQWYLESQALNISTNYELVVFAMAMFSQQAESNISEWAPGTFRSLDHDTLIETCAIEALQEWWVQLFYVSLEIPVIGHQGEWP